MCCVDCVPMSKNNYGIFDRYTCKCRSKIRRDLACVFFELHFVLTKKSKEKYLPKQCTVRVKNTQIILTSNTGCVPICVFIGYTVYKGGVDSKFDWEPIGATFRVISRRNQKLRQLSYVSWTFLDFFSKFGFFSLWDTHTGAHLCTERVKNNSGIFDWYTFCWYTMFW